MVTKYSSADHCFILPLKQVQHQVYRVGSSGGKGGGGGGGQWKPALQSIAEVGTSTAALCLPT